MIVSIYSSKENSGKKTVALNLATELANTGKQVLLVDLDYKNPINGEQYKLTHSENSTESYLDAAIKGGMFSLYVEAFKATESEMNYATNKPQIEQFSENLSFMLFSNHFKQDDIQRLPSANWDNAQCFSFMARFMQELRESKYDVIVLSLPNNFTDMFCYPIATESDYCINLAKASTTAIHHSQDTLGTFLDTFKGKLIHVLNEVPSKLTSELLATLNGECITFNEHIPFDNQLLQNEIEGFVSSSDIKKGIHNVMKLIGVDANTKEIKRALGFGIFNLRSR